MTSTPLHDDIAQALVGDVDPDRLEGYRFAVGILPVFKLIRALFSQNELDTCLKLMLLHELSSGGGRWSLERIRAGARFLDPSRIDALVRSLRDGDWLELRASDNTYVPSLVGVNLLSLLAAADLANLSPQNALARAAQNAEFGARLDGGRSPVSLLLDQLHVLIEDRVEEARAVLQVGRPARMIAWAQGQHAQQLDTIRGVLTTLADRLDAASREFSRVVRLHEVMQELVRMHTSIHARLRDWNLERLYSSESGYSLAQLAEAVVGAGDATFERVASTALFDSPPLAPSLSTDEVRARFHGARRRLPGQEVPFVYASPVPVAPLPLASSEFDATAALRTRLTAAFAVSPGPLDLEAWVGVEAFGAVVWELSLLCRLEGEGLTFPLDDGRRVVVRVPRVAAEGVPAGGLVDAWGEDGGLRRLGEGWYTRVTLHLTDTR